RPVAVGENAGRRRGKVMAPMTVIAGREDAAMRLMRAGRDNVEPSAQPFTNRNEREARFARARLNPNDRTGAYCKLDERFGLLRRELGEHMAEEQRKPTPDPS